MFSIVIIIRLPKSENSSQESDDLYRIEFIFDADYPCSIQIYFNAREYAADQEIQSDEYSSKILNQSIRAWNGAV